jgi:hypothetical protein
MPWRHVVPLIPNPGISYRGEVSFVPQLHYFPWKNPHFALITRLRGPQIRSRHWGREIFCPSLEHNHSLTNNPIRCTILFWYIYICLFCTCFRHPSAHHQEKITVSMQQWYLSLWMGGVLSEPANQMPPIQSDKYQCCIDTVIFSWRWAFGCLKHVEKRHKYIQTELCTKLDYLWDYTGMHGQPNIKNWTTVQINL